MARAVSADGLALVQGLAGGRRPRRRRPPASLVDQGRGGRRAACRQTVQRGSVRLGEGGGGVVEQRARKAVRVLAVRSRRAAARATAESRSTSGDTGPGGGSRIPPVSRVVRPDGPGSAGQRGSFPRVRHCPTRPHYPRRMPGMPPDASDAVRLSRARGYLRRSRAQHRRCLLGGSPVPPAECLRGPGRRPVGGRRRRAGPAGELRRGLGARHDGRAGRRRSAGDHPRGLPRRSTFDAGRPARAPRWPTCAPSPAIRTPSRRPRGWLAAHLPGVVAAAHVVDRRGGRRAVAAGEFDAAVCAPIAAERYGLATLAEDIADHPGAVTRFVLVAPPGSAARADRQRQDVAGRRRG